METTIRSSVQNKKKDIYDPVFDLVKTMIELKLPSLAPKAKIEQTSLGMSQDELNEWKTLLKELNKR